LYIDDGKVLPWVQKKGGVKSAKIAKRANLVRTTGTVGWGGRTIPETSKGGGKLTRKK